VTYVRELMRTNRAEQVAFDALHGKHGTKWLVELTTAENWIDTLTLGGKSLQIWGGPSLPWQPAAKPLAVTSFKLSSAT
jgi:hypothetical protein